LKRLPPVLITVSFIAFISGIALLILAYPYRRQIKLKLLSFISSHRGPALSGSGNCKGCASLFPDKVKVHQLAYVYEGIDHQQNDDGLKKLFRKGKLAEITSNQFYTVLPLQHSQPLLLPNAVSFLDELSRLYDKKCKEEAIEYIPFTISSLTRSTESVRRLMKSNANGISNSAHLKGKTFDISYRAFNNNTKQNAAFIHTLNTLRIQGKCYVKFERNGCLHITVV